MTPQQISNLITESIKFNNGLILEHVDLGELYHATTYSRLRSIQIEGLDPQKSVYADEEEANDAPDEQGNIFGPPYHFTFLSSLKAAKDFLLDEKVLEKRGDKGVILKINLPPNLQKQLVLNRGEFIRAPFVISPKYISIYKIYEPNEPRY